ncbi:MAG: hypothetical protein HYT12_00415 [Candidatus Liptonbacteria bacterium]|nr:hypothetical protein [Candidatus Liptonbacteria bacterium]
MITTRRSAFTAIEMLFVLGAITVLTTLLILYNRVGQNQLILFSEKSKLVSVIYRARSLSIQTFAQSSPPCGYGVHFENNTTYSLYKNQSTGQACEDIEDGISNSLYDSGGVIETYTLHPAVVFSTVPSSDILFIPPDPAVRPDNLVITMSTTDGTLSGTVTLSDFGQISI